MSTLPVSTIDWDASVSLKHVVESMPIAVVIVDAQGHIVYVNAKLEELFGYAPDELTGKMVEVLMPARFHNAHVRHRTGYMHHPHVRSMGSGMDLAGKRRDGSEFPLEAGLSSLNIGSETFVFVTVTDVTKRKEVEEFLARQVEERTQEVLRRQRSAEAYRNILAALISNHSLLENLEYIAAQAVTLMSADLCIIYSRDERSEQLEYRVIQGTVPQEVNASFVKELARMAHVCDDALMFTTNMEPTPAFESLPNHKTPEDGSDQWHFLTIPVRDTQVYGLMLYGFKNTLGLSDQEIDIALRMGDLAVLAFAHAHLRAQIAHSAVTAERSRIARDLHDAVTQTLFSASIIAGVLPNIWQRNQEEGFRRLDELRELTRGALAEMRTLLLELRPAKLVEVDMADLLRQLAEALSGRARIPVTVEVEGDGEIPADVKVAFYRVAQEALNNVAKHAQAHNVLIHLIYTPDEISLTVKDDGIGFAFKQIAPQHLGLGIMRERADAIGASLAVVSAPREGTSIEVRWQNSGTTSE